MSFLGIRILWSGKNIFYFHCQKKTFLRQVFCIFILWWPPPPLKLQFSTFSFLHFLRPCFISGPAPLCSGIWPFPPRDMTLQPKDMTLIITNWRDTVYSALDVFQWNAPSELGTVQNYVPLYTVSSLSTDTYYVHKCIITRYRCGKGRQMPWPMRSLGQKESTRLD